MSVNNFSRTSLPLASAMSINLATLKIVSQKNFKEKTSGMPGIKPGASGCEARMLSIVLYGPPYVSEYFVGPVSSNRKS